MTYPLNALPEIRCPRCGVLAEVQWCDVSRIDRHDTEVMPGRIWCETPGCLDQRGRNVVPMPPQPGELTQDDRDWVDGHMALTEERR